MNPKTIGDEVVKALGKMRGEKVSLWELRQAEEYIKIVLQGLRPSK